MEMAIDTNIFLTVDELYEKCISKSDNEQFRKFRFFYVDFFSEFIKNKHTLILTKKIKKEYMKHFSSMLDRRTIFGPSSAEQYFLNLDPKIVLIENTKFDFKKINEILDNLDIRKCVDKEFIYVVLTSADKVLVSNDHHFGCFLKCENKECLTSGGYCKSLEICKDRLDLEALIYSRENNGVRETLYFKFKINSITLIEGVSLAKYGRNIFQPEALFKNRKAKLLPRTKKGKLKKVKKSEKYNKF